MITPTPAAACPRPADGAAALVLAAALLVGACDGEVVTEPPPLSSRTFVDLVYAGAPGGSEQLADLYLPAEAEQPPVVVLAHGGGFFQGEKEMLDDVAVALQEAGLGVLNVNYRLVGVDGGEYPASAIDVRDAVRFLRANADDLGAGPVCGTWGSSAGGTLAALAAFTTDSELELRGGWHERYGYSDRADVYVGVYGVYDFTLREEQHGSVPPQETDWLGGEYAELPDRFAHASPATYVQSAVGPVLLLHGEADGLIEVVQAHDLQAALDAEAVHAELVTYPDALHSFLLPVEEDNPDGLDAVARSAAFLAEHCQDATDPTPDRGTLEVRHEGTATWDGTTWSGEELYALGDASLDMELCSLLYETHGQARDDGAVDVTYTLIQQGAGCDDTPFAPPDGATWTLAIRTDTRDGGDALFREADTLGWFRWFDLQQAGEELTYGIQQRLPPSYGR